MQIVSYIRRQYACNIENIFFLEKIGKKYLKMSSADFFTQRAI